MRRLVLLWALLVLATGLSWLLGADAGGGGRDLVGCAVIGVAFVKFRLVGIHFMRLGTAPLLYRAFFEAYVGVAGVTLVSLYLLA